MGPLPRKWSACSAAVRKEMRAMLVNQASVVLRGGPSSELPEDERVRYVTDTSAPLKLLRGNRYEHFEPSAEKVRHGDRELQVFVWAGHTYVAE